MELYNNGKFVLIAEGNEFRVGTPTLDAKGNKVYTKMKYYYKVSIAVASLARLVAIDEAISLKQWLDRYEQINMKVLDRIKELDL